MSRSRRSIRQLPTVPEGGEGEGLQRQWLEDSLGQVNELSDRVTELSTLMGVSTLLSSERPLPEVLESVCRLSSEICKAHVSFIHLADGDDDLVCVARHTPTDSVSSAWEGAARVYGRKSIQKGEIVACPDLLLRGEGDKREQDDSHIGGICAVPLKGKARTVGSMSVVYGGTHRFSARERDMLSAIAAQLAMAVERGWLLDRLQEGLARANRLREMTTSIGSDLDMEAVLDAVVGHACALMAAEYSAVFLLDRHGCEELGAEGRGGSRGRTYGSSVPLDSGPLGDAVRRAIETASPAIAQNPLPHPSLKPPGEVQPSEYLVALAVPLLSHREVLGALVMCYLERRRFDPSDISLAEEFAGQVALSIRNAQLYEDAMENRVHLEDAINQINNHGISVLDEGLNIRFANPATFWLLGIRPRRGEMPLANWTALLKKSLVDSSSLDQMIEQVRANPEKTMVVELLARGAAETPRCIRLLSLPLRHADGTVHGRVNLLEESSQP